MSDTETAEAAETETEAQTEQKPTETVDFWKQKAREQEKRAKDNAAAAKRLAELEDAQKSEAEKANERVRKAEAEVEQLPAKVADALKAHLVALHSIDEEDAELFLTASEPDLLLKQVTRLLGQTDKRKKNHVPKEGTSNPQPGESEEAAFVRDIFSPG